METTKPHNNGQVIDDFRNEENAMEEFKVHAIWGNSDFRNTEDGQNGTIFTNFHPKRECPDEPIDLTFTQKNPGCNISSDQGSGLDAENANKQTTDIAVYDEATSHTSIAIAKIMEVDHFMANGMPKKKYRKKKPEEMGPRIISETLDTENAGLESSEYLQHMDQKQAEVLKAAKSLFSKRTRTLYHWMYPNTPKSQLKAAVSMSWETLGVQEKEFYISQVLGRFGFPQNSLMVNPQLDGIRVVPQLLQLDITPINERKVMGSSILLPDNMQPWAAKMPRVTMAMTPRMVKKRGRIGRPPGSKNRQIKEEENVIKQIQTEPTCDEFQDDPELSREFEQFKWTLHMNEKV